MHTHTKHVTWHVPRALPGRPTGAPSRLRGEAAWATKSCAAGQPARRCQAWQAAPPGAAQPRTAAARMLLHAAVAVWMTPMAAGVAGMAVASCRGRGPWNAEPAAAARRRRGRGRMRLGKAERATGAGRKTGRQQVVRENAAAAQGRHPGAGTLMSGRGAAQPTLGGRLPAAAAAPWRRNPQQHAAGAAGRLAMLTRTATSGEAPARSSAAVLQARGLRQAWHRVGWTRRAARLAGEEHPLAPCTARCTPRPGWPPRVPPEPTA